MYFLLIFEHSMKAAKEELTLHWRTLFAASLSENTKMY